MATSPLRSSQAAVFASTLLLTPLAAQAATLRAGAYVDTAVACSQASSASLEWYRGTKFYTSGGEEQTLPRVTYKIVSPTSYVRTTSQASVTKRRCSYGDLPFDWRDVRPWDAASKPAQ